MDVVSLAVVIALLVVAGIAEWDVAKTKRRCSKSPEDIQ